MQKKPLPRLVKEFLNQEQIQSMTGENAACQMSWETPGTVAVTMFCYWKAKYSR